MAGAAVDADSQIEVIAQPGRWPGDARIAQQTEAIRVRVGNYGQRPVQVRYEHFRLVSGDGRSYALLPPSPTRGHVPASARRIISPRFRHVHYRVAPYYGAVYAGIPVHPGAFRGNADGKTGVPYRKLGHLPNAEMIDWAIPEGVLDVGGFVDGYMFFDRIPDGVTRVELRGALCAPRTRAAKGTTEIPWVLAKAASGDKALGSEIVARVSIPFRLD